MDKHLVYVKTPTGDEAVRQSTHVVKRNLRMVLVQVDGKLSVAELSTKIGNRQLVEGALRELEADGFVAPTMEGVSVWEEGARKAHAKPVPPFSDFSSFEPAPTHSADAGYSRAMASSFSRFEQSPKAKSRERVAPKKPDTPVIAEKTEFSNDGKHPRWMRTLLILVVGGFFAGLATLIFYPYDNLRPRIEASVTQYLQVPVQIGSVQLKLLPKPNLQLSGIKIGERTDSTIESISLSPLVLIGSGKPEIQRLYVSGASLAVDGLHQLPFFASTARDSQPSILIHRIDIERLSFKAGDLILDGLNGEILLRNDGRVEKAEFQTVDRSIRVSALPSSSGLLLNLEGYGWKPFANLALTFDSLQAKALLQPGKLIIHSFDSTLLGGLIKGSWLFDWTSGMTMVGDGSLARLDARKVSAAFMPKLALEGEMAGIFRLRGNGLNSPEMWRNADAGLDLAMSNGVLHGIDLGEAVRRGSGSIIRGGATKFDRLSGAITFKQNELVGRNIQLDAGRVIANGQFSATADQRVDSTLVVTMQTSVSSLRSPVRVSGVLPDLSTVVNR
jgi:hypothetical protein